MLPFVDGVYVKMVSKYFPKEIIFTYKAPNVPSLRVSTDDDMANPQRFH